MLADQFNSADVRLLCQGGNELCLRWNVCVAVRCAQFVWEIERNVAEAAEVMLADIGIIQKIMVRFKRMSSLVIRRTE